MQEMGKKAISMSREECAEKVVSMLRSAYMEGHTGRAIGLDRDGQLTDDVAHIFEVIVHPDSYDWSQYGDGTVVHREQRAWEEPGFTDRLAEYVTEEWLGNVEFFEFADGKHVSLDGAESPSRRSNPDDTESSYAIFSREKYSESQHSLDNTLLSLSCGGIGLHMTLFTVFAAPSYEVFYAQMGTVGCFLVATLLYVWVLHNNVETWLAEYRYATGQCVGDETLPAERLGARLTRAAMWLFLAGIAMTVVISFLYGAARVETEQKRRQSYGGEGITKTETGETPQARQGEEPGVPAQE